MSSAVDSGAPMAPLLDLVVVGAGLSGLVAAHRAQRAGLQVQVIEAGGRAGGVIGSAQRDGFLFERGPNSAMDTSPLIGELIEELGLQAQLRWASAASDKRYVVRGGRLIPLPLSPGAFFATPLFSISAKLGLLAEPFKGPSDPALEESIATFVRRRLGSEFLDYAIDPFVSGIYAGDPEQISVKAAFPKLHALEQRWGSLIRGQILGARERKRAKETAKNTAKSFSFLGGMQVLPDALAAAVGSVVLHTRVTALERDLQGVYTLRAEQGGQPVSWRTRRVLLAMAAGPVAELVRPHAADAAAALDAIAYAPVATVASAYRSADLLHPLDGFGCLLPGLEKRRVLGILFNSSMFEGRAPQGHALLTTFIGGRRHPDLPAMAEEQIAALAHAEHGALLGTRGEPLWQVVTRWPRAIPQYTLGHLGRVARAQVVEQALPGVHLCASWRGGVAVGDCVRNGHQAALAVIAALKN
ncbi:MAG TPA: protoporphyrinogen oxidase [Rubrivivax sp.]|nr:protoporphyrinogen oxidase [Rubrivivax sp.]